MKCGEIGCGSGKTEEPSLFPQIFHRAMLWRPADNAKEPGKSAERLEQIVHQAVERRITLPESLYFLNRVDNRGMMFAAKAPANFRQRGVRQRLTQVHRDLPRHRDRF